MLRTIWYLCLVIALGNAAACTQRPSSDQPSSTDRSPLTDQRPSPDETGCANNDFEACNRVGLAYERAGDPSRAAAYFRKTCEGHLVIGCSNLGEYYLDGRGVQRDVKAAFRLFMSACTSTVSNGCPGACIIVLAAQGSDSTTNKFAERCIELVQRSCDNGNDWMCPQAKRLRASFVTPTVPETPPPAVAMRGACPDAVARVVAHAYTLSNPFNRPEEFESYVADNRSAFEESGPAVMCAAALGAHLVQSGLNAYDPTAYERAMGSGPAEFAPDVARSINSGSVDLLAMGQELSWLATIFPDVANGRLQSFLSGGTHMRVQLRSAMAAIQELASVNQEFAQNLEFGRAIAGAYSPIADQQVLMLARMMPR
jgi:TPR repeat protein